MNLTAGQRHLIVERLPAGLTYAPARTAQARIQDTLAAGGEPVAHLLLLEHAPVYTLGRATRPEHLACAEAELASRTGAEVVRADRGGSVTYHGPGQLTAYLLLNLKVWDCPIHRHLWNLEETAIRTLARLGLTGQRVAGMTGAWVPGGDGVLAKVCAIGVGARRWVTCHGLALNVCPDLRAYEPIDPCGLGHRPVTSLVRLLGREVRVAEVAPLLAAACAETLGAIPRPVRAA